MSSLLRKLKNESRAVFQEEPGADIVKALGALLSRRIVILETEKKFWKDVQYSVLTKGLLHKDELVILGISISDTKKALKNFTKSFNVDYPLLYGSSRDIEKVSRDYGGIYSVPMTFLIDKTGEIRMSYPGALMKGHPMHTQFQSDVNLSLAQPYQK